MYAGPSFRLRYVSFGGLAVALAEAVSSGNSIQTTSLAPRIAVEKAANAASSPGAGAYA
jgi:hypothetical protein